MKYRTRPEITIEAEQWTGKNLEQITEFAESGFNAGYNTVDAPPGEYEWAEVYDYLQQVWVPVNLNDFVIKGTKGEFYPCDPEVFEQKYETVEDDQLGLFEGDLKK